MSNRKKWALFVPTYKREHPLILKMLDLDPELEINLCCRHEEIEAGFYDKLAKIKRVNIVDLGRGLTELGRTRQRIIYYCVQWGIDYCFMFDDGIFSVNDSEFPYRTISQIFDNIVDLMEVDAMAEDIVAFTFVKRQYLDPVTNELKMKQNRHVPDRNYFITYPGQALCIKIPLLTDCDINYHGMTDVGFEDAAFFGDCLKAGLVFAGRKSISIDGVVPNAMKAGGSHADNFNIEKKYDKMNKRTLDYLNIMGAYFTKKYEAYIGGQCSFIKWDFDYFYDVLCVHRQENKTVIRRKFRPL